MPVAGPVETMLAFVCRGRGACTLRAVAFASLYTLGSGTLGAVAAASLCTLRSVTLGAVAVAFASFSTLGSGTLRAGVVIFVGAPGAALAVSFLNSLRIQFNFTVTTSR